MAEAVVKVKGMTCNHCRLAVGKALEKAGYKDHQIDLKTGEVKVSAPQVDAGAVRKAIEGAGYQVTAG
ncbi:MAG TPA: cation-transporting ATPase [Clostridiales bacterium UBA8153]|nr:cation-transporting ATPase [Clostridiales bacterium UBA8153]